MAELDFWVKWDIWRLEHPDECAELEAYAKRLAEKLKRAEAIEGLKE